MTPHELTYLHHPCQSCILVTEYLDGGELFERVVEDDLTEADCCAFIAQVAIHVYIFI